MLRSPWRKRNAGEEALETLRTEDPSLPDPTVSRAVMRLPDEQRTAQFVCAVTCLMPDGRKIAVQGVCPGVILRAPRGEGGFGYDPVFYLPELGKTFAELAGEEKNRISHRGRALREFCRVYREENHHDE